MQLRKYLPQIPVILGTFSILLSSISFSKLDAALIPVGLGGYTTDLPAGRKGPTNNNNVPVSPKLAPDFTGIPQTNDWWTSLIWNYNSGNPWSENLFAHPFSFRAQAIGLEVGYPTALNLNEYHPIPIGHNIQEYHYSHKKDLTLGVSDMNSPDTKVSSYSDWAVTAYWEGNGKTMHTTLGRGLPFVYVTQTGGNAVITSATTPTIWSNANGVLGLTINGHHYGIFAPNGSTWTINGKIFQSTLNTKDYYSIAVLPDNTPATLEFFRQHAYAFVTNTQVSWAYNDQNATLTTTYAVQTTLREPGPNNSNVNRPLLALYRHQWLHSNASFLPFTYHSPRGAMKVVDNSQFTTSLTSPGVLPFLPNIAQDGVNTYSNQQLYTYIDTIYKQSKQDRWRKINSGTDTYWTGKALARVAHLIPIADSIKHGAARDLFIAETKDVLNSWLNGKNTNLFYYNDLWKTLIGFPASYGSDNQLNDHHFHYGYYIMAAAIIAHYDPTWAQENQWGGMVNMLIKDCQNWDKTDQRFPFLRHFDIYAGHSWASGTAAFGSGNNEESSSEDFNFITALILWGSLTENKTLRDLGIFLYATNVSSVPQYWFDVDNEIFPEGFVPNTLGMVWGNGGAYAIWWNGTTQELHGINFLPIQPGMLYLGHFPDYLKMNHAFMLNNGGTATTNEWFDIHTSVKALYDPAGAIADFNNNVNYKEEGGDSKPHTYYWIHNINQLGSVDKTVTADIPTYQVFNKNGAKTHVAYNPHATPITVTFSDGVKLNVAGRSIATSIGGSTPPPPTHEFTDNAQDLGEVTFSFTPNWTTQFVKLNYQINSGASNTIDMINHNNIWQANVIGLKHGDTITYYYTYEDNGSNVNSPSNQHVYQCTGGSTPTPPTPPAPISNTIDDTTDYTLKADPTATNLNIKVITKQNTSFVDLHYKVNNGGQLNYRMAQSGNEWTFSIPKLKSGDSIQFSLTYDINRAGRDSKTYTYTYQPSSTSNFLIVPHEFADFNFNQGIDQSIEGELKIWFKTEQPTESVDIHYLLDDESLQTYRMNQRGEQWEYTLYHTDNHHIIDYSFSYEHNGNILSTEYEEQILRH